jgi:catechol 2,3-dioxygenase-like lactoylglutathione lyase family enzyme
MNPKLHVSLDVDNIEESVRFYSLLFNTQPTKLKPGYAKFDLENPAVNLTMQEAAHCCLQGLSHMGIRVDSTADVLAYRERLAKAGLKIDDEMETVCCHALQDKIWLRDPSGYRWEIYVFKGDIEERERRPQGAEVNCVCGSAEEQSAAKCC